MRKRTPKQVLRSHIVNEHRRQPAPSMTYAALGAWHANEHHRYTLSHYHGEGRGTGPNDRPKGWYTGEDVVKP